VRRGIQPQLRPLIQPSGRLMARPRTPRWPLEAARGGGSCVRSDQTLFVLVVVAGVGISLGDASLVPTPNPAAEASKAALTYSEIAFPPL
jgi:hypothetical protein